MSTTCNRLLALLFASALLGACGTMMARREGIESKEARVYGGTVQDVKMLGGAGGMVAADSTAEDAGLGCLVLSFAIVDLPFSFVADTVMLPITIYEAVNHDEDLAAFHALAAAAGGGDVEAARRIVDRHARAVGWWNDKGESVLDIAARSGTLPMVEFLVASGAAVGFRDGQPFQAALLAGRHDVATWMHDHGITSDQVRAALFRAIGANQADAVAFVLAQHWFPADGAVDGDCNLLSIAARDGKVALLRVALDGGADVNHATATGFTALHAAVWGNRPEAVRFLLARGANAAAVYHQRDSWFTSRDRTALSTAVDFHEDEIARLLRDADENAKR